MVIGEYFGKNKSDKFDGIQSEKLDGNLVVFDLLYL